MSQTDVVAGKLRMLYEAFPMAYLTEHASVCLLR